MKLYVVGVGPGDPSLITLKGLELLKRVSLVFYPTGGKDTFALSIIKELIPLRDKNFFELHIPMNKEDLSSHYEKLSDFIYERLAQFKIGAFITLGDPAFYSTFYYFKNRLLARGIEIEIVPGINSPSAASARFSVPLTLGDEEMVLLPAKKLIEAPEKYKTFDTLVLMKGHKFLEEISAFASKYSYQVYIGYRITQEKEKLWINPRDISAYDLDYFTIIILKRGSNLV